MRKLVESTFMTLDGVIGSPQDWSPPYWDEQHGQYASDLLLRPTPFWVFPVTAGSGERLFEGVGATLELLDTTTFKSGIVVGRYAPT